MKKIFLVFVIMFANTIYASNQDYVKEISIQLPIQGQAGTNKFPVFSQSHIEGFNNKYNTFIIHPIAGDHQYVTYEDIRSSEGNKHTKNYIINAVDQAVKVKAANADARIYIGTPYANEGKNDQGVRLPPPSKDDIRQYFYQLSSELRNRRIYWNFTGIYMTDEFYYGDLYGSQFNYFIDVKEVMGEYIGLNAMPLMWMPTLSSEKIHKKISNLLNWQNNNFTIFERVVIQPGFVRSGNITHLQDVIAWTKGNNVSGVNANSTRIGAMLEFSASVDWCRSHTLSNGNNVERPRYVTQHRSYVNLLDDYDVNIYFGANKINTEWNNNQLDWEIVNGNNPFALANSLVNKELINLDDLNQEWSCN